MRKTLLLVLGLFGTQVAAQPSQVYLECTPTDNGQGWRCSELSPAQRDLSLSKPVQKLSSESSRVGHTFRVTGSSLPLDPGHRRLGAAAAQAVSEQPLAVLAPSDTPRPPPAKVSAPATTQPLAVKIAPVKQAAAVQSPSAASALQATEVTRQRSVPSGQVEIAPASDQASAPGVASDQGGATEQSAAGKPRYTLQLAACMVSDCLGEAKRLGVAEARVFQLRQGEKRWSVILAGKFHTVKEARAMASKLTAHYGLKQTPWVRSFSGLAKLMGG